MTGKFLATEPADQCFTGFFSELLKHQAADLAESNEIFRADVEDLSGLSQRTISCRSTSDFLSGCANSVLCDQYVMKQANNSAQFSWTHSALDLLFCAATYTLIWNGIAKVQINPPSIPGNYQPSFIPTLLYGFWGIGIDLAIHTAATPCVEVEVGACRKV